MSEGALPIAGEERSREKRGQVAKPRDGSGLEAVWLGPAVCGGGPGGARWGAMRSQGRVRAWKGRAVSQRDGSQKHDTV